MRDYSLNNNSSANFILRYDIVNDFIFISYADGTVETKPYSIETEKRILEKMKTQVLNSNYFSATLNQKFETFFKLLLDEILLLVMFITTVMTLGLPSIPTVIGSIIFPIIIGLTSYKLIGYQKVRKDIKKNLLFLNNEDSLNLVIRDDPEITKGLNDKVKEKVMARESNNFVFTLNTIDKMEYKELQQVYEQVDKTISNGKYKALTKRNNTK